MAVVKSGSFIVSGAVGIKNEIDCVKKVSEDSDNVVNSQEQDTLNHITENMIRDANIQAEDILKKAREDADLIIKNAEAAAVKIQEKAQADGFNSGYERGIADGKEIMDKAMHEKLDTVQMLIDEINNNKALLIEKYENDIVETVFDIAQKILLDSLNENDKDIIRKIVKNSVKHFRTSKFLKISICNNEYNRELAADEDFLQEISANIPDLEIELLKDAQEGTIILDNGNEITDASISVQLKMIEELGKGKFKNNISSSEEE